MFEHVYQHGGVMPPITRDHMLLVLKNGSPQNRVELIKVHPAGSFKDQVLSMIQSDHSGMGIVALSPLVHEFCYGRDLVISGVLASAVHEQSLEIWLTITNHGLLTITLSGLASSRLQALTLQGRFKEVLETSSRYLKLYSELDENENFPSNLQPSIYVLQYLVHLYLGVVVSASSYWLTA